MNKKEKTNKPRKQKIISKEDSQNNECQEFIQILSDFMDLELTENHLIKLRSHLTTCVHCTQVYREFRTLVQLCRSELIAEPRDVSSRLWQTLEKRFKRKGF